MTLDQVIFCIYGFSGLDVDFWSVKIDETREQGFYDVYFLQFNAILSVLQTAFHTILVLNRFSLYVISFFHSEVDP